MPQSAADNKWYFNIETGEVSQGKESNWDNRMGPYDSAEEARGALERAEQRNAAADAAEEADDDWGVPPARS